jgi:hypothetical protein
VHVHPFDDDGRQTLAAEPCAATIRAVRATCPGISISLTTSADAEPNPQRRMALVEAWTETPDLVTANQGEDSILEMCERLVARGIWNRGRTAISRRRAALRGCRHRRPLFPHHGRTARRRPDAAVAHAEAIGRTLAAPGKHGGGSGNEIAVAGCCAPVGQDGCVLQTGPDAVSARDCPPIDRGGRDARAGAPRRRHRVLGVP